MWVIVITLETGKGNVVGKHAKFYFYHAQVFIEEVKLGSDFKAVSHAISWSISQKSMQLLVQVPAKSCAPPAKE